MTTGSADAPTSAPSGDWIAALRSGLLDFFDEHAREMPWRETKDPYAIWISEIMLQQTRVETVIPYFNAWMEAFPTPDDLAEADQARVLKRWEGLGYYSRARNLHRAARVIREEYGGRLPDSVEGLRSLPGVGPYTAGAVGSIAFGLRAPAVDGNVRRVTARLLDWPDPSGRALESAVDRWVPEDRPGDFNQALMELGATVCTPRNPGCYICPVSELCAAREAGTVGERPVPRKKAAVRREVHAVEVVARNRALKAAGTGTGEFEVAIRQRPQDGLLAGLWEFPGTPVGGEDAARDACGDATRARGGEVTHLDPVPHAFTHLHVTYVPSLIVVSAEPSGSPEGDDNLRWVTRSELEEMALPVAQQKIARAAFTALENHADQ